MPDKTYTLIMQTGPIPGDMFQIKKQEILIGRELSNDVPIPDPEISRKHARVIWQEEGYGIEDLGSTNGTFVNGLRVTTFHKLNVGDIITLGESVEFRYDMGSQVEEDTSEVASAADQLIEDEPEFQQKVETEPAPTIVDETISEVGEPIEEVSESITEEEKQSVIYDQSLDESKPRKKFPIWLIIILLIFIIIGLILTFMPASWWCAITLNLIPACPVQ